MAHLLFDALNGVALDSQTALTVQSLLDTQVLPGSSTPNISIGPPTTVTLDEEDVFQCGKCKKQFTSFSMFMSHKKEHNPGPAGKVGAGGGLSLSLEGELQGHDPGPSDGSGFHHLQVHTLQGGVTSPELGQPIILGDTDILSFSIDQASLNLASTAQGIPSLSSVVQNGAFLAQSGDSLQSPKGLVEDETSSTTNSFNVATLTGQPIILTSSELAQGSFLASALPGISTVAPGGKLASLQTESMSTSGGKDASRNFNIVATYPGRLVKGCKVLLPNIDYIERDVEGDRATLLDCDDDPNKKTACEATTLDNKTLLLDYSGMDGRKTCKVTSVLMPNVEYSETSIEYIDCSGTEQNIIPYQSLAQEQQQPKSVEVDMLDVIEPSDSQLVTLNPSKTVSTDALVEERAGVLQPSFPGKSLKLKCDYCPKSFAKNFDLQQHLRSHTGEKPFQCVVCGRAFSQKSNVKKHMATHKVWPNGLSRTLPKQPLQIVRNCARSSQDDPEVQASEENDKDTCIIIDRSYVCQYCNSAFPSYFELKTHMKEHSHQKVYKCIQRNCQKTFSDLDAFLEHTTAHTNEVQYCCHMCGKKFTSLSDLGVHQYCHSQVKTKAGTKQRYFLCVKCKSKFTSSKALEHHLSTTNHNFPCPNCGKVFACERYLRRHLPTHGAPESFICPVCGKGFRTEQYLNTHRLIHTGEKPFACQHCPAAFNRKDKLVRHCLIHQTVKKYKCPFSKYLGCTKAFNRQDKLKLHILTHSAVKPYQCRRCRKVFSKQALLREHEKTHSDDDGLTCHHCGSSFKKKTDLAAHSCSSPPEELDSSQEVEEAAPVRGRRSRKGRAKAGDNVPTIEIIVMPLDRRKDDKEVEPTLAENEDQQVPVAHLVLPKT